jgi:hypothetical protein
MEMQYAGAKIDKEIWRVVKSVCAMRGQPIAEFVAKALIAALPPAYRKDLTK